MKTVLADPESFEEDGGWKGMLGDEVSSFMCELFHLLSVRVSGARRRDG